MHGIDVNHAHSYKELPTCTLRHSARGICSMSSSLNNATATLCLRWSLVHVGSALTMYHWLQWFHCILGLSIHWQPEPGKDLSTEVCHIWILWVHGVQALSLPTCIYLTAMPYMHSIPNRHAAVIRLHSWASWSNLIKLILLRQLSKSESNIKVANKQKILIYYMYIRDYQQYELHIQCKCRSGGNLYWNTFMTPSKALHCVMLPHKNQILIYFLTIAYSKQ
jgi:hypothetical protein